MRTLLLIMKVITIFAFVDLHMTNGVPYQDAKKAIQKNTPGAGVYLKFPRSALYYYAGSIH